jgi:hypothetical protein
MIEKIKINKLNKKSISKNNIFPFIFEFNENMSISSDKINEILLKYTENNYNESLSLFSGQKSPNKNLNKINLLYVKLLFKYRNIGSDLKDIPDINFIKYIVKELPETMHNEEMIYLIYKNLQKNN